MANRATRANRSTRETRLRSRNAPPTRQRSRRIRLDKRFFILIGLLAAAGILFLCLSLLGNGSDISLTKLNAQTGSQLTASSKNLFSLNGTTLTAMDFSGGSKWSISFKSSDLTLTNSDTLICVYNADTANVLGTDQTAGVYINAPDFKIKSARCGVECVAILTESTDAGGKTTQNIRVFTAEGVEVDKIQISTGVVLTYDFYNDSDELYYLTLDSSGVVPVSRFSTVNPKQQTTTCVLDTTDNMITDVFFANDMIYLSGTTNLSYYEYNNYSEKQGDMLVYGLECVDTVKTASKFLLLYVPRTDSSGITSMRLLSKDSVDTTIQLPESVLGVFASSTKLYCFSSGACYTYEHGGSFLSQTAMPVAVTGVKKLSSKYLLLTSADGLYMMELS